ncbi:phospholipase A2 [Streptomyces sp. ZAF1911]|uniref:phospholipase A2 n=1 Tax=unclassified Streptomyces TaxID=2593676 RepID=UPI00237B839E|nr:phospholipase A2 [Streptomyces sp. ZAF1911]MDD9376947.1 phospholipase A2 [Streptomyces sp. ZAF1911]
MRRSALPIVAAMSMALLLPQNFSASAAEDVPSAPLAAGEIQNIGPGMYESATNSYEISETDIAAGLMGRTHTVAGQAQGGVSQAQDAPQTRSDLGVFGPSWEAEFVGGQLNRKLTQDSGSITTTDLDSASYTRYDLTDSLEGPGGGSINTYKSSDGSTLVENVTWDDLAGEMKSSITETLNIAMGAAAEGDNGPKGADGNPIPAADLNPTYTWKQVSGTGDTWRVTSVGNKAYKSTTVAYDAQGRVATVSEPARGDNPAQSLALNYATATTATGSTLGDVAGQVKDITVTTGQTVQTLARYTYEASGLLREVKNPAEGSELNAYTYDGNDRLSTLTSGTGGAWELTFSGAAAAPQARETSGTLPDAGSIAPGQENPDGVSPPSEKFLGGDISDPQANPRSCSSPEAWIRWWGDCSTAVAHYGWRWPSWKQTPTGYWVRGIFFDHCTDSYDRPSGFDFRSACDAHDYAYGTIGNTWKGYSYYLDRSKDYAADGAFYSLLKNNTCPAYSWWVRGACDKLAYSYYLGVLWGGNPYNGARNT